jgi:hypothetical protein
MKDHIAALILDNGEGAAAKIEEIFAAAGIKIGGSNPWDLQIYGAGRVMGEGTKMASGEIDRAPRMRFQGTIRCPRR